MHTAMHNIPQSIKLSIALEYSILELSDININTGIKLREDILYVRRKLARQELLTTFIIHLHNQIF